MNLYEILLAAKLHARSDVDAEGISNEAWLEQDLDEDEEEDEEVTRKLYGDDD